MWKQHSVGMLGCGQVELGAVLLVCSTLTSVRVTAEWHAAEDPSLHAGFAALVAAPDPDPADDDPADDDRESPLIEFTRTWKSSVAPPGIALAPSPGCPCAPYPSSGGTVRSLVSPGHRPSNPLSQPLITSPVPRVMRKLSLASNCLPVDWRRPTYRMSSWSPERDGLAHEPVEDGGGEVSSAVLPRRVGWEAREEEERRRTMERRTGARIADLELERREVPVDPTDPTLLTPGSYDLYERDRKPGGWES